MQLQSLIRYGSYPAVMLPAAVLAGAVASGWLPAWLTLAMVSSLGIAAVAWPERVHPYEQEWLRDCDRRSR